MDGLTRIMLQDLIDKTLSLCGDSYEDCVSLLSDLIACESLSGREKGCAETLVAFFNSRRIPCFVDERGSVLAVSLPRHIESEPPLDFADEGRDWLKAELEKARDKGLKILAYNAHIDVVAADNPEEWRDPPFRAVRKFGRIFGRGACDMKGALAAMAMALTVARELDRDFDRQSCNRRI